MVKTLFKFFHEWKAKCCLTQLVLHCCRGYSAGSQFFTRKTKQLDLNYPLEVTKKLLSNRRSRVLLERPSQRVKALQGLQSNQSNRAQVLVWEKFAKLELVPFFLHVTKKPFEPHPLIEQNMFPIAGTLVLPPLAVAACVEGTHFVWGFWFDFLCSQSSRG